MTHKAYNIQQRSDSYFLTSQMSSVIYLINKSVSWLAVQYRISSNLTLNRIVFFSSESPITSLWFFWRFQFKLDFHFHEHMIGICTSVTDRLPLTANPIIIKPNDIGWLSASRVRKIRMR